MNMMTMTRYRHTRTLLLLLLLTAGASGAWAADDSYTVPTNSSEADITYKGNTQVVLDKYTYTTLTLGFAADSGTDIFKITKSHSFITFAEDGKNPTFTSSIPTGGHVYVFTTTVAGDFSFHVKLNNGKTMCLRNSSGIDVATKANSTGENREYENWTVTVETAGTYYLFANGSKLDFFSYTFTKKPIQGITQLPYSADFSSDTEPFEQTSGSVSSRSTTNVGQVLSVSATGTATPGIATAYFKGGYTPKQTETVTISFTAYHGWNNYDKSSTVDIRNTSGQSLVKYTYNQNSTLVTDVSFGGTTASGFEAFSGINKYNTTQNANGFAPGSKPYVSTAGYNPTITMTICGNGLVTFSFVCSGQSVSKSFSSNLEDIIIDLGSIVVTDAITHSGDQSDRAIGIDDLRITSQLYSSDYENTGGLIDWTTDTSGRYTPTIMEEAGGNHYMGVNQEQRYNNGATLTNTLIDGAASADEDFTLEFDMKIGRSNRNQSGTKFTVFDAANSELFSLTDEGTTDNRWKLAVVGGGAASNIDLPNTSTSTATDGTALAALDWYHYKLSYNDGVLYITITSRDGSTTYWRGGTTTSSAGGLKKMTFDTKRHYANFAFDNLTVSAYANTNYTVKGKVETYDIASGGDLRQVDEGKTIKIEYGDQWQVQQTKEKSGAYGAYCLDANIAGNYSQAYSKDTPTTTSKPDRGTFYKFTPKFNGKLSISGWVNDGSDHVNNVTLQKVSDGSVIATYLPSNNDVFDNHLLDVELSADEDYYLYASTPKTANCETSNTYFPTLFLTGFKFEQTSMNREIKVSDLLYINGKTQSDGLNREIPGFNLSFTGGSNVAVASEGTALTLSSGGTMTIAVRENGYSAKISNITLNVSEVSSATVNSENITETGKHSFTISSAATATLSCTAGSLTITSLSVGYTGDDNNNTAMWLDDEKITTPVISFTDSHIMRVAGDGKAFTNTASFSSPSSLTAPLTYTSSNSTIATINSDGTNGQLLKNGEVTITATFAETDYFNSASATYTVSNVLKNGESYERTATVNDVVRINALAADADKVLTLTGTQDVSFTLGTASSDNKTTATGTTVTLTNGSGSDITIERLRIYAKRPVAWLYYEGQEENYAQQLVFKDFPSGPVKGFRVLDIGDPTDPIDLTDTYQMAGNYVWTDGTNVTTTLGGTFSTDDGRFTASSQVIGEGAAVLPTVSHALTRKAGAPSDGYSSSLTAENYIYVATPTIDGDDTYYYTWDMTTSVSSSGQLDSRWTWNGHGYYQAWMPEYLPILNNSGKTLAGNEGLLVKGDLRYHTGSTGLRMNLTRVNAHLKFPVKKGMEIKIEMASAAADIDNVILNVTDVKGDATKSLYIEYQGIDNPVTAYYLAKEDGAVELQSMDKMGGYVKRITLQVPKIHFDEEIVTVLSSTENFDVANIPFNTGEATLTYTIATGSCKDENGASQADNYLATIPSATVGRLTVNGNKKGHVTVNVADNNMYTSGIHPKKGSFELYVIDFHFSQSEYSSTTDEDLPANGADFPSLDLSSSAAEANNGEAVFNKLPDGYDKVVQPVNYTLSIISGAPRGRLIQTTKSDPTQTRYTLSAYSEGTFRVTATTGRISTYCDVVISGGGSHYEEMSPVIRLDQLAVAGEYMNKEPFTTGTTTYEVDKSGTVTFTTVAPYTDGSGNWYTKFTGLSGAGALRVKATNVDNKGNDDSSDDVTTTASFILTVAYPASAGQRWDFYRMKHYTHDETTEWGLYIGKIDDYNGDPDQTADPNPKTVYSHSTDQHWNGSAWNTSWSTSTKWEKVYRKGEEQPRWAYAYSVKGDNAFIIEETAGLIIETGLQGMYTDNPVQPDVFAHNHIGLHNNSTITIPKLKQGDFIALNLNRVLPNNGAILSATNVNDLAGTKVDHNFTISRSQTDYHDGSHNTAKDASGARIIPGYYTFRAAADGDVSFTLEDEGYLDILSIEIYDANTLESNVTHTGNGKDGNGYYYTMQTIKEVDDEDNPTYPSPTSRELKEDNATLTIKLAICNIMWSTSVGPAEYVLLDQIGDLNATLENVEWTSRDGAYYNRGLITANEGYGKLLVRMNNYTAEGRYLIGYTPTYQLTVGHPPHQDYPYTWNFENISGGAVKNRGNNVYNSVSSDPYTWTGMGYETYQLDTRTSGGSLYVPGGTLVSAARDLGAKGTISELNAANLGCDEFNGLGFNGQITFKLAQLGDEANDAPTGEWSRGSVNDELLHYTITYSNLTDAAGTGGYWTAADGKIKFGQTGKRVTSAVSATGAAYQMDGGNSKNLLLKPQRPLKDGDQIYLRGYTASTVNVLRSGFSFYAGANDNAYDALKTLHWDSSVADTEHTITYTVSQGDGLAGRDSVYLFRADKQYTVFLIEVRITGDDSEAPTAYERAITCNGDVTVTIPDLVLNHYVYIKSSAEPKTVPSSLTKILSTDDGTDGYDVATGVYKYKVTTAGNADVVFADGTKIYRIGVTNIMKPMKRVGSGDAWATESRDHAIDYKQTGVFTVNDITANTVTATNYALQRVTVRMNEQTDAMPAETGMVLKLPYTADKFNKTRNYNSTAVTGEVPLFYPPYSTPILSSSVVGFGGTQGNLMMANLDERELQYERETGVIDKDGDNVDDSGAADGDYTRFIFTERYMKWTKVNNTVAPSNFEDSGDVPVFARMHLYAEADTYKDGKTVTQLNTLGANKAYMLIRSGNVPQALWNTGGGGGAKGYIGIEGISDWYEDDGIDDNTDKQHNPNHDGRTYNLKGQVVNGDGALPPGIYIKNGRKFVVK